MEREKLRELIKRLAFENAIQHEGTAKLEAVVGRLLALYAELRPKAKEMVLLVSEVMEEVKATSPEEQQKILSKTAPIKKEATTKKEMERRLPSLPNAESYSKIHVRFCPNPDGALHLGSARAAILCDEYTKMYQGTFTLRFDDTDPKTKSPIKEAYNWIREDLKWLGIDWHQEVYQSDRLKIYYGYAETLLRDGNAYVCTCTPAYFRALVTSNRPCVCRELQPLDQLSRWWKMLDGSYEEGDAVVRVKTNLNHPNPAVRDWPALRIINVDKYPHPRTGSTYHVWPLFAFCCGVDDHELDISHIIRGKEHLTNSTRQLFLYQHLGWKVQEAVHYGRLKIVGAVLSKSKTREGIKKELYKGWDDPRLGTLMALRRRGFLPQTVRQIIMEVGPKPVDATISWENVESANRKLLDPISERYFFVADPIVLRVRGLTKSYEVCLPLHPSKIELGYRKMHIESEDGEALLLVSQRDVKSLSEGSMVRLMELFNIQVEKSGETVQASYLSESYREAREKGATLIHWVPASCALKAEVVMPDAGIVTGKVEDTCSKLSVGDEIQFERFGFVRVDSMNKLLTFYFTHR